MLGARVGPFRPQASDIRGADRVTFKVSSWYSRWVGRTEALARRTSFTNRRGCCREPGGRSRGMRKFCCAHCGHRLAVPPRHLDKLVTCPECGKATHPLAVEILSATGVIAPSGAQAGKSPNAGGTAGGAAKSEAAPAHACAN